MYVYNGAQPNVLTQFTFYFYKLYISMHTISLIEKKKFNSFGISHHIYEESRRSSRLLLQNAADQFPLPLLSSSSYFRFILPIWKNWCQKIPVIFTTNAYFLPSGQPMWMSWTWQDQFYNTLFKVNISLT